MNRYSVASLKAALLAGFLSQRVPTEPARVMTNSLIQASLFGIDSHGVRLFSHYLEDLKSGRIRADALPTFKVNGSTVSCDANWGLSHYAALKLLQKLKGVASTSGIAVGTIRRSDHIGALGIHAVNAGLGKYVTLSFSNANALALAPSGDKAIFGTNPFSLVTGAGESLVYIDFASTSITMNRVKMFAETGQVLPEGAARDMNFVPTTNPYEARYLEPLGGHKGFALAYLVEIMTSGLVSAPHSSEIPDMYSAVESGVRNLSHTFVVINPRFFPPQNPAGELSTPTHHAAGIGLSKQLPGSREKITERERLTNGIPVPDVVVRKWSEYGVKI